VATHADLADYHRQRVPASCSALRRLVEEGRLVEVAVEGWSASGYMRPDARVPRRVAFAEPHAYDHPGEAQVAAEVAAQLSLMSSWLELDRVDVELHGDLASGLVRAVAGSRR
jgi:uncharacterized protein YcaQ